MQINQSNTSIGFKGFVGRMPKGEYINLARKGGKFMMKSEAVNEVGSRHTKVCLNLKRNGDSVKAVLTQRHAENFNNMNKIEQVNYVNELIERSGLEPYAYTVVDKNPSSFLSLA